MLDRDKETYVGIVCLSVPGVFGGRVLRNILLEERVNFSLGSFVFLRLVLILIVASVRMRIFYRIVLSKILIKNFFWFRMWGLSSFSNKLGRFIRRGVRSYSLKFIDKGSLI